MKRTITYLLASLLITSSTEIHQLLKIPSLLRHFRNHKSADSSLSFIGFLKIHYTGKHHPNDNDDKEDNELPFKYPGNILHIDTPVVVKKETVEFIISPGVKINTNHDEGLPCHRSFSIFHPPRIA